MSNLADKELEQIKARLQVVEGRLGNSGRIAQEISTRNLEALNQRIDQIEADLRYLSRQIKDLYDQ